MTRGTDFPIQNLPFAAFRRSGSAEAYRGGVAIGDAGAGPGCAARARRPSTGLAAAGAGRLRRAGAERAHGHGRPAASALRAALSQALRAGAAQQRRAARAARAAGGGRVPRAARHRRLHRLLRLDPSRHQRSGGSCAPTIRCCPTTSGCRSPITAAPPRCASSGFAFRRPQRPGAAAGGDAAVPRRPRGASITSSRWACSSASGNALGASVPLAQAEAASVRAVPAQ